MITDFGKALRIYRIEHALKLKDMADILGVPSSYLSAIEMGRKPLTQEFYERIIINFTFSDDEKEKLYEYYNQQLSRIAISLENVSSNKRNLAINFARKFEDMDDEEIDQLLSFIKDKEDK